MKKKIIVLVLAAVMILSSFAACQSTSNSGGSAATTTAPSSSPGTSSKENFNPTGYPIVDNEITVKGMYSVDTATIGDPDETLYWKELRKLTNIKIDWTFVAPDPTTVNLYFAAGNFPDFFLGSLTNDRVSTYGVQGGNFLDISDMIYEYMPHMVSRFAEWPQMEKIIRQLNGEVYTIPQVRLGTTAAYGQMFYRTDYLEQAGVNVPKTVDDYYAALKAVADAKLTGGYAPLLPYNKGHLESQLEGFLFPAFGDAVEPGFADDGTGKVVYNFISEQYKRYLEYMHRIYTDGLLEKEIFSIDPATTLARIKSGNAAFMTYAANLAPDDFADGKVNLDGLAPLVSEYTSTQKVAAYPYLSTSTGGINKNSKYAREILRMLDIAYAKEEVAPGTGLDAIAANSGIKGISYNVFPEDNTYEFVAPADFAGGVWAYVRFEYSWNVPFGVYDMMYYNKSPNAYAREKGMVENNIPYAKDRFPDAIMKYTSDESLQMANKLTDIMSHVEQMRAKFITGVESLANWDEYVSTINKMGLQDVLKIKQAAYDRWND